MKPQDLGIDKIENKLEILKIEEPPIRQAGVKVDNVDQLIEKLKRIKKPFKGKSITLLESYCLCFWLYKLFTYKYIYI